jgi:thymidine phosphorylase
MYALRDVTGTVPSIPLITASILSKKLAEGIEALVLDVKFGCAAFMQTRERAQELATIMTRIANESGVKTRALLSDMNTPLGRAAGNWLELRESVECLEGRGPDDLRELVIECAASLLEQTGRFTNAADARSHAADMLVSGQPLRKWDEMLARQGADMQAYRRKLERDHTAPIVQELKAQRPGVITRCDARVIGEVIRDLGGGRHTKETVIDPSVGVDALRKPGETVRAGDVLCRVHAANAMDASEAVLRLQNAFQF